MKRYSEEDYLIITRRMVVPSPYPKISDECDIVEFH